MSTEFSRIKRDVVASTVRAQSVKADRAVVDELEVLNVTQIVNAGAVALGPTGAPTAVDVKPANLSGGYDLVGTYTSADVTLNRFVDFTLTDGSLVVGDTVIVSGTPNIASPTTPVASATGSVVVPIEFAAGTVGESGAYKINLTVVRV